MDASFFDLVMVSLDTADDTQIAAIRDAAHQLAVARGIPVWVAPAPTPVTTTPTGGAIPPAGTRVRVNRLISPKYMAGLVGTVGPETPKTSFLRKDSRWLVRVSVMFDSLPLGIRFKGPKIWMPVDSLEVI